MLCRTNLTEAKGVYIYSNFCSCLAHIFNAVAPYWVLRSTLEVAGLTSTQLHNAFGIDQGIDLTTFNALGDAMQSPNGVGLGILKV